MKKKKSLGPRQRLKLKTEWKYYDMIQINFANKDITKANDKAH